MWEELWKENPTGGIRSQRRVTNQLPKAPSKMDRLEFAGPVNAGMQSCQGVPAVNDAEATELFSGVTTISGDPEPRI